MRALAAFACTLPWIAAACQSGSGAPTGGVEVSRRPIIGGTRSLDDPSVLDQPFNYEPNLMKKVVHKIGARLSRF